MKKGAIVTTIAGVTGMLVLAGCTSKQSYTQEQIDKAVIDANTAGLSKGFTNGVNSLNQTQIELNAIEAYKTNLDKLEPAVIAPPIVAIEYEPYLIDGLQLGNSVGVKIDDSDFGKLKEEDVELDDETYTFREYVDLTSNIKIAYSGGQFDSELGDQVALELSRSGAVVYYKEAEDDVDWDTIDSDDPLRLNFLGKTMTIVKANEDTNEITIIDGNDYLLKTGETIEDVTVEFIGTDSVLVSVKGVQEGIKDGQTKTINGKRIRIETFASGNDDSNSKVLLTIGANTDRTFEDGDAYIGENKNNPTWEWSIDLSNGLIGIKHAKSLTEADEVYEIGDALKLPNDFLEIKFVKISNEKTENYEINFDTIDINGEPVTALMFEGKMEHGVSAERENKIALVGNTFYAQDGVPKQWTPTWKVNFEINHMPIELNLAGHVLFDNVAIDVDFVNEKFTAATYGNIDLSKRDADVLTQTGFVIKSPENNFDKTKARMVINAMPSKQLEFGLKVEGIKIV